MNRIEFLKSWLAWGRLPVLLLALAVAFCTKVYAADMRITDFGAKPDGSLPDSYASAEGLNASCVAAHHSFLLSL